MADKTVKINLEPLRRFRKTIEDDLRGGGSGPVRKALKQWAVIFFTFTLNRFKSHSRGGGDWKPLKPSTIKRRRRGKTGGIVDVAILTDTGTLRAALQPSLKSVPGQVREDIPFGIRVGYGGPTRHGRGGVTISDIASFHQHGSTSGNLPARPIIVKPDREAIGRMTSAIEGAVRRLASEANR